MLVDNFKYMSEFFDKKRKTLYIILTCLIFCFSNTLFAQQVLPQGTQYYSINEPIELQSIFPCAESLNWNINLENLTLLSPSCASQQGRVHFTLVSNYEMSSVTVLVDNGADPTNAVFNNINLTTIIFDENLSLNNYLEPVNTTNNIDNNGDGIPDVLSYGNPYSLRVTATIDGCTSTFYIPNVGNDLCNSGECVGSSSSGVEFLFDVPADYDPIEIDYTVTPPDCYGDPSIFEMNTVTGGGCTDDTEAPYFIQVNDQIYTGVEQTIAGSIAEFDIFVNCMNVITNQDTWCPEVVTHFTEVIDQYDVTPYVQPSSCADADDGSINVQLTDNGNVVTDAVFSWQFTDPSSGQTVAIPTDENGQITSNSWGFTGGNGQINNLTGDYENGVRYQVTISTVDGCALNNNIPYDFYIYEPSSSNITDIDVGWEVDTKDCGHSVSCNGGDDTFITLYPDNILEGNSFSENAVEYANTPSILFYNQFIAMPDNSNIENYQISIYNGNSLAYGPISPTSSDPITISSPVDLSLTEGDYTLSISTPSGQDDDFDGVGNDDGGCTTEINVTITEPETIEINLTPDDFDSSGNLCYNESNGEITWDFGDLEGGCPNNNSPSNIFGYDIEVIDSNGNTVDNLNTLNDLTCCLAARQLHFICI